MFCFTALLFPVLDVLRFLVLQSAGNEHFVKHDQFVEYACTQLHCQSHPKNQLVMLRVLCNMFQHTAGERFIAQHSERLFSTALSELHESAEKNIQVCRRMFLAVLSSFRGFFRNLQYNTVCDFRALKSQTSCQSGALALDQWTVLYDAAISCEE